MLICIHNRISQRGNIFLILCSSIISRSIHLSVIHWKRGVVILFQRCKILFQGEFLRTVKNSGGYHGNSESGDGWVPRVEDDAEEEPDHVTPSQGGVFDFVPSSWQVPLFWALSTASVLLMATMVTVLVLILKRKPVDANKLGKDGEPLLWILTWHKWPHLHLRVGIVETQ